MLYLEPEFDPPDGLIQLLDVIRNIFPHCTDLIRNGVYTPHMSVARFTDLQQLLEAKKKIEIIWRPLVFTVKELYLLSRIEGDPFEVKHVIMLGNDKSTPYFGDGSKESSLSEESQLGRTVFLANLPTQYTLESFRKLVTRQGFAINNLEICMNPDGKQRTCGIVEFKIRKDANTFVNTFKHDSFYARPMYKMAFPGTVGDSCSYNAVQNNPLITSIFNKLNY